MHTRGSPQNKSTKAVQQNHQDGAGVKPDTFIMSGGEIVPICQEQTFNFLHIKKD